jgi:hypothetical protein
MATTTAGSSRTSGSSAVRSSPRSAPTGSTSASTPHTSTRLGAHPLQHGAKGGGPYGKSYKIQRLLEQLAIEERSQTHIGLYGHWHSDLYLGRYQGVFGFTLPCFKSSADRFHRQKGLNATIGGLVLEVEFTRDMKVWNIRQDWRTYEHRLDDYPGARKDRAA